MLATNACPPAVVGFAARCSSDSNKSKEDLCHHTRLVKQVLQSACNTARRRPRRRGLLAICEKSAFNTTSWYSCNKRYS